MADLTEAQYLSSQADDAAKAISKTASALKTDIANTINPLGWAKQYPWMSLGAAALAGFAAASAAVPSKEEQTLKRLARVERALMPEPPPYHSKEKSEEPKSIGQSILSHLLSAVQPALSSVIAAYTAQAAASGQGSAEGENGNGHAAESTSKTP